MSPKRLLVAGAIIAFAVVVAFLISVPRAHDVAKAPGGEDRTTTPAVVLRDVFKKGVHTITGSVKAPNACGTASSEVSVVQDPSGTPTGIQVLLTLTVPDGVCLQVPTAIPFSTTVDGPAGLPLSALVNGVLATTTLL